MVKSAYFSDLNRSKLRDAKDCRLVSAMVVAEGGKKPKESSSLSVANKSVFQRFRMMI